MTPNSLPDKLLRGGLALAFLYYGLTKLLGLAGTVALYDAIGFGQFPRYVTGSVETLGAVLLWLPRTRALAGLLLAITMIIGSLAMILFVGGAWWHLALLFVLSAVVALTWRDQLRQTGIS